MHHCDGYATPCIDRDQVRESSRRVGFASCSQREAAVLAPERCSYGASGVLPAHACNNDLSKTNTISRNRLNDQQRSIRVVARCPNNACAAFLVVYGGPMHQV
jgi:hypothetical protein